MERIVINPDKLTIPAHESYDVEVIFRTQGLIADNYHSSIVISSNDPAQPELRVPVNITIGIDVEPPILTCPPDTTVDCDSPVDPLYTGMAVAIDFYDKNPVITYTDMQNPGVCANEYTINRIWTATDACGNVATATQIISVVDISKPVITGIPESAIVQGNDEGNCGAFINYPTITATDNCSDVVDLIFDPTSGSFFSLGTTMVTVTATDDCGNTETAYFNIEITNEIPVIDCINAPVDPLHVDTIVKVSAEFTDNNLFSAVWDWGDGSTSEGIIDDQTINGEHPYTSAGLYEVTLTITDQCGETATEVYRHVVVFDPNGGLLTGLGWIKSPAGDYLTDPSAEGLATFGMLSMYPKNATTPFGTVYYQLRAGDLKFRSTQLDWMVIDGSIAILKGAGTINNSGDYGYMVYAEDADLSGSGTKDKLRIKIWYQSDGTVIYDNADCSSQFPYMMPEINGGFIIILDANNKEADITKDAFTFFDETDNIPEMLIYPNPAEDYLNIKFNGIDEKPVQIRIYNSTGELVHYAESMGSYTEKLHVSHYKPGIYIVTCLVNNELLQQKVIIK
jgi:PKD repeat protein